MKRVGEENGDGYPGVSLGVDWGRPHVHLQDEEAWALVGTGGGEEYTPGPSPSSWMTFVSGTAYSAE